jgi:hypothetical protein
VRGTSKGEEWMAWIGETREHHSGGLDSDTVLLIKINRRWFVIG